MRLPLRRLCLLLLPCALLLAMRASYSPGPNPLFLHISDTTHSEVKGAFPLNDGFLLVTTNTNLYDIYKAQWTVRPFLERFDKQGKRLSKIPFTFGGSKERIDCVIQIAPDRLLVCGQEWNYGFMGLVDTSGTIIWSEMRAWREHLFTGGCMSSDGHVLLTGKKGKFLSLVKISVEGKVLWSEYVPPVKEGSALYGFGHVICETKDAIFVGGSSSNSSQENFALVKFSRNGKFTWQKTYFDHRSQCNAMVLLPNGDLVLAGEDSDYEKKTGFAATRVTANGDTVWTAKYGTDRGDYFTHAFLTAKNNLLLAGEARRGEETGLHTILVDQQGKVLAEKHHETETSIRPQCVCTSKEKLWFFCQGFSGGNYKDHIVLAACDWEGNLLSR